MGGDGGVGATTQWTCGAALLAEALEGSQAGAVKEVRAGEKEQRSGGGGGAGGGTVQ